MKPYPERKHYSQKIEMPAGLKHGLKNFVQMIINEIEDDNPQEALLKAVDLLNDLECGVYDSACGISKESAQSKLVSELKKQNEAADINAKVEYNNGFIDGIREQQKRVKSILGL